MVIVFVYSVKRKVQLLSDLTKLLKPGIIAKNFCVENMIIMPFLDFFTMEFKDIPTYMDRQFLPHENASMNLWALTSF